MNAGFFFELDEQSDLAQGPVFFHYTRIFRDRQYPISVQIGPHGLSFYWSVYQGEEDYRENEVLFQLFYSDYEDPKGKLARDLNRLCVYDEGKKQYAGHRVEGNGNFLDEYPVPFLSYSCPQVQSFCLAKGTIPQHYLYREKNREKIVREISLVALLLDFLFDLKHSEVFTLSPHFDLLRRVLRENFVFHAIAAKAEYYYQQTLKIKASQNEITRDQSGRATQVWLEAIMHEQSPEILVVSPWFASNLEQEAKAVLKDPGGLISKKTQTKLVEWYLSRFNYLEAGKLTFKDLHQGIGEKIAFLAMPRLLITLFLSWIVYAGAALKIPQISWGWMGLYLGVSVGLVYVYLAKEIKLRAPDVPVFKMGKRIWFLIAWTFVSSAVMGVVILSVAFDAFGREAVINDPSIKITDCLGFEIAFQAWASATIFVFFFGLFVNLLFSGKKFTGF